MSDDSTSKRTIIQTDVVNDLTNGMNPSCRRSSIGYIKLNSNDTSSSSSSTCCGTRFSQKNAKQRSAQDDYSTISYDSDIPNDMIDDAMNPNISSCGGMNFHMIDVTIQDVVNDYVSQSQSNDDDEYPEEGTCCGKNFYFRDEESEEVDMVESCLYPMMEENESLTI